MNKEWLAQYPTRKYGKGSHLFTQGDDLSCCFYILEGICSHFADDENGVEVVTKYCFPGDLLNIWGVMKGRMQYTYTVGAKTDVQAVLIPTQEVRDNLDESFEFYRWAVEPMLQNNMYVFEQYQKKAKGNAAEMLCYTIQYLSQRCSTTDRRLPKVFSFVELAQHLRIHRITVAGIFKALQDEQILDKREGVWTILKPEALEEYAQGVKLLRYND